jgi:drug/metabolite transporter (DMT)-like permease
MTSLSRRDWLMVVLVTVCWGFNWPIMKIGVQDFPPLSFRVLSMLIGLPLIALAARYQKKTLSLRLDHLMPILRLTIPNMLIWHTLIVYGVRMLSSGRAAILGYTMPVWAVLAGVIFFHESIPRRAWFGIVCALMGALLLLSSEFGNIAGQPLGSAIILIGAAAWGYGTVVMKRSQIDLSTIALTFWMLVITTIAMSIGAIVLERGDWRVPTAAEFGAILYNGVIIFGLVHVMWFRLARLLPPVASSISVMMIPVVGVFSGAWILNESPHWQDYAAILLILVAMSAVLLKPRPLVPI